MNLNGKSAIVTAAASGVGKTIAELLARQGVSVAIADVSQDAAQSVANGIQSAGGKAISVAMDVTSEIAVNRATDRVVSVFGGVDILVSNPGVQVVNPVEDYAFADLKRMLAIHIGGALHTTKAVLKHMYPNDRGGTVIYMGSVNSYEPSPLKSVYTAGRLGLLWLARMLAKEGAAHNVRSHVIVRTPLVNRQNPEQTDELAMTQEEVVRREAAGGTVDAIFTTVEETVLYLCEFPSAALSGQSFMVSHGWFIQQETQAQ